jgi:undecaprenyl-diphosphatase
MDMDLLRALNGLAGRSDWFDRLLRLGAGDLPAAMMLTLVVVWFWRGPEEERSSRQRLVAYACAAAALGLGVAQIIGHAWFRDRPYVDHPVHLILSPSGEPSFPSDHPDGAFGLTTPFLFARRRIGWVLLGMALAVSFCRVAAGTHYPSDVLGGAIIGTLAAAVVWSLKGWLDLLLTPCLLFARRFRLA